MHHQDRFPGHVRDKVVVLINRLTRVFGTVEEQQIDSPLHRDQRHENFRIATEQELDVSRQVGAAVRVETLGHPIELRQHFGTRQNFCPQLGKCARNEISAPAAAKGSHFNAKLRLAALNQLGHRFALGNP